jgi:hypothetical protein
MSGDDPEDGVPTGYERSDFLRGQLREWTERVAQGGHTAELFELEMWLQAFERFFRVKDQPLSDKEMRALALRNWSEELRLVDNVILRVVHLCTAILTEEKVDLARFDRYVEGFLRRDEGLVDPYITRLIRQTTPEAGLALLKESFEDIHVILVDLVRLSRLPYVTFTAVGKILYREVRRSHLLALLIDKKFKPVHDRVKNPAVAAVIRGIKHPIERKQAAKVFLEMFRLLHYLEYANPEGLDEDALRNTILVFALINAETRLLLGYIEKRVLHGVDHEQPLYQLYDSFVYCIPLELKKVINTELIDISVSRQAEGVRTRVENSHGILKDCFQQSIVQLAQNFEPTTDGSDIFPDFMAKLDQSVRLRDGLARLINAVRAFQTRKEEAAAVKMKEEISVFYDHHIKFLMYRDWSGFELFFIEILKCGSLPALSQIAHRFETFLVTLFREIQKRSILQNVPVTGDVPSVDPVSPGGS